MATRTPLWKQGTLHSIWSAIVEHLRSHWIFDLIQLGFAVLAFRWWWHNPFPGYAIGATAVLAAAMTFHIESRMKVWQKSAWLLLIGAFLMIEFSAIRHDRAEFAQQDAARRHEENTQFKAIADDLKTAMTQNQANFATALTGIERSRQATTGGDSFCYMVFNSDTVSELGVPTFVDVGEFPLTDVNARIVNLDDFARRIANGVTSIEQYTAGDITVRVGDLPPKSAFVSPALKLPLTGDSQKFRVIFDAKNGHWMEDLIRSKVKGKWMQALRVRRIDGNKTPTIFKQTDKGFPLKNGRVEWPM